MYVCEMCGIGVARNLSLSQGRHDIQNDLLIPVPCNLKGLLNSVCWPVCSGAKPCVQVRCTCVCGRCTLIGFTDSKEMHVTDSKEIMGSSLPWLKQ